MAQLGSAQFTTTLPMCQHRRGVLTAYSSLWTHLEFEDVEKMARASIERSKSSSLGIALYGFGASDDFLKDAFLLAIPHISRVVSALLEMRIPFKNSRCTSPASQTPGLLTHLRPTSCPDQHRSRQHLPRKCHHSPLLPCPPLS